MVKEYTIENIEEMSPSELDDILIEFVNYSVLDNRYLKLLLAHGASLDARDDRGNTPLHRAVINQDKGMIILLIAHGSSVYFRDTLGRTALDLASLCGNIYIHELLRNYLDNDCSIEYLKNNYVDFMRYEYLDRFDIANEEY